MRHVNRNVNKAINYVSLDQWFLTSLSIKKSTHRAWEEVAGLTPRISD